MLFSEPKIPQFCAKKHFLRTRPGFSALQRAENSSMHLCRIPLLLVPSFQCSSASRKFLNLEHVRHGELLTVRFSALQRAENSSMLLLPRLTHKYHTFQCSSASRKFLNFFHAENDGQLSDVSVLFSEPKIPQCNALIPRWRKVISFSALQRAENSSIKNIVSVVRFLGSFSALQRAENSSIGGTGGTGTQVPEVSVLFSEPKIPQCVTRVCNPSVTRPRFSALQRAENSSIYKSQSANEDRSCFSALQRAENSSI